MHKYGSIPASGITSLAPLLLNSQRKKAEFLLFAQKCLTNVSGNESKWLEGMTQMISSRSVRGVVASAMGAGAVAGALLFGGAPTAQAAPAPAPATSFDSAGPHSGPGFIPDRPGDRGWGGHDGRGNGHWDRGNWGRGPDHWDPRHWPNWWW